MKGALCLSLCAVAVVFMAIFSDQNGCTLKPLPYVPECSARKHTQIVLDQGYNLCWCDGATWRVVGAYDHVCSF